MQSSLNMGTSYCSLIQDGGDAAVEASPRDIVYVMNADDAAAAPSTSGEIDVPACAHGRC